jgi:hypothetical protein
MRYCFKFLGLLLVACTTASPDDKMLQEAADVHNSALLIATELKLHLQQNALVADSVSAIVLAIKDWENDGVEVPGNRHQNHEEHTHSSEPVQVTAKEMLNLQQEWKARIIDIKKRVEALTL